jgi:uncharacterized protein (DUF1499 family)
MIDGGQGFIKTIIRGALLLIGGILIFSCSGKRPINLGVSDNFFSPCPDTPNCVSSDAKGAEHGIQPYALAMTPSLVWQATREAILQLPRTKIVTDLDGYLHVECRSAVFEFVDDFELHLRSEEKIIAVRSAARMGSSDFGVNRDRVEQLRTLLITSGFVR